MKIMAIDDEPGILRMLGRHFKKLNYEVALAESGARALELLATEKMDLLILDQAMPEMDGMETFAQIKKRFANPPPVIMATAHGSLHLAVEFMKAGGSDFVQKPLDMEILVIKIERAVRNAEMEAEVERKLRLAEAELSEARQLSAISRIAASIAHEIRQPLVAADLALSEVGAAEARGYVRNALQIIRTMMRIYRGKPNDAPVPTDVNRDIEDALALFAHKSGNVEIRRDFTANAVVLTNGNLSRVFINLISNAFDAMNGTGRLYLGTSGGEADVVVTVEDSGPGIPPENIPYIFEPDFTTKKIGEGTGLGLWMARRELDACGGCITVESEPDKFARFVVTIPRDAANQDNGHKKGPHHWVKNDS